MLGLTNKMIQLLLRVRTRAIVGWVATLILVLQLMQIDRIVHIVDHVSPREGEVMEEEGLVGSKTHDMPESRSLRLFSAATVSRSLVGGAAVFSTVVTLSLVLVLVRSRNVPAAVIVFVAVSRQSVLVRTRLGQPSAAHLAFDVKERMLDLLDALAVATVVVG